MLRRILSVVLGSCLCAASAAHAGVPSVSASTEPSRLELVGYSGTTADPRGAATFVIRRLTATPVAGAVVIIDFSACTDVSISSAALGPNVTLDCATHTIRAIADGFGQVTLDLVGSANGAPPRAQLACAAVYANGVPFLPLPMSAFDLDGRSGVTLLDFSQFAADMYSATYHPRSDYNGDGNVNGLDASILAAAYFSGASSSSGSPACP